MAFFTRLGNVFFFFESRGLSCAIDCGYFANDSNPNSGEKTKSHSVRHWFERDGADRAACTSSQLAITFAQWIRKYSPDRGHMTSNSSVSVVREHHFETINWNWIVATYTVYRTLEMRYIYIRYCLNFKWCDQTIDVSEEEQLMPKPSYHHSDHRVHFKYLINCAITKWKWCAQISQNHRNVRANISKYRKILSHSTERSAKFVTARKTMTATHTRQTQIKWAVRGQGTWLPVAQIPFNKVIWSYSIFWISMWS